MTNGLVDTRTAGRLARVIPHLVALVLGIGGFLLQTSYAPSDEFDGWAMVIGLMISPAVGAALAIAIRRPEMAERRRILGPYLVWAAIGIALGVLVYLVGPRHVTSESSAIQEIVAVAAAWAFLGAMAIVPMLVPFLRAVVWAVSPPNP